MGDWYRLTTCSAVSTMAPVGGVSFCCSWQKGMALRSLLALLSRLLILSTACLAPASALGPTEVPQTPISAPAPTDAPALNATVTPSPANEYQDSDCPCEADNSFHRHPSTVYQHADAVVYAG